MDGFTTGVHIVLSGQKISKNKKVELIEKPNNRTTLL